MRSSQGGVQIKQEPVEKTEVSIESEYQMSKEQLIQLHRLEPLQKGAEGKKETVCCAHGAAALSKEETGQKSSSIQVV